jgi:gamma-glutamylcyclotransferase (GGCT)/AIG2-like uncharacterized protein YtfP
MKTKPIRLFVWGTLKRGRANHEIFMQNATFLRTAQIKGFPSGEIFDVPDITKIDEFEAGHCYKREELMKDDDGTPVYHYAEASGCWYKREHLGGKIVG